MQGSTPCFFDSNIIIYCYDTADPAKQKIANRLLAQALEENSGRVSAQVIQECLNVFTSKARLSMTPNEARESLDATLAPLFSALPPLPLYEKTLDVQSRYKFSFYDALIISAALQLGCHTLYTEDLQHGQKIEGLKIINPFLK